MSIGKLGQSLTAKEIVDLVRDDLARVEQAISLESLAPVEAATSVGQYLQANGGKRLRPIMLLLACRMVGPVTDSAIHMAAVVELIHTATLVHDDVIDESTSRRGKPSPNVLWGNQVAVLSGDWLYMQAFQVALRERNFRILELLNDLTQMMVEGELLQLERIGKITVSETDYMELIDRKTASLFSGCAKLGAIVGSASPLVEEKLGEFAWNLGIAFQLIDDILDFTAEQKVLGKPVGSDLREGKVTLPVIYALEHATPREREAIEVILATRSYERIPFTRVADLLERYGTLRRARERAGQYADRARAILHEFPDSAYQRALLGVTELVTNRAF